MPRKKVGTRNWGDLPKITKSTIRGRASWKWGRPLTYMLLGNRDTGKSNTLECFALRHNKIIDLYGSKDNESLCWLRESSPIEGKILLVHGDNTDIESSWPSKRASEVTLQDMLSSECVTTCGSFYSSDKVKYGAIEKMVDKLYYRHSWNRGDIIFLAMRETMDVIYSRLNKGEGEKDAKAYLLHFIRQLRHFGVSVGADILRWTGTDKELRDLSEYILIKKVGWKGLPKDLRFLYSYIDPVVFRGLGPDEFIMLKEDGAIAYCTCPLMPFHKEEGVDLLAELGIIIEHGDEIDEGTDTRVGDREHSEIIELYNDKQSMRLVAEMKGRSYATVSFHVSQHNKAIQQTGQCPRCTRVKSELSSIDIYTGS